MRRGLAATFAKAVSLSGDGGDIVLSERARHPIRVAIGRRGAALRRPSLVLGASTYARYGSAAAVVGSNKIVGLTRCCDHQFGPTDKEMWTILLH